MYVCTFFGTNNKIFIYLFILLSSYKCEKKMAEINSAGMCA